MFKEIGCDQPSFTSLSDPYYSILIWLLSTQLECLKGKLPPPLFISRKKKLVESYPLAYRLIIVDRVFIRFCSHFGLRCPDMDAPDKTSLVRSWKLNKLGNGYSLDGRPSRKSVLLCKGRQWPAAFNHPLPSKPYGVTIS